MDREGAPDANRRADVLSLHADRRRAGLVTSMTLSDSVRRRILDALGSDERCVCDLQQTVEIAPGVREVHRILAGFR